MQKKYPPGFFLRWFMRMPIWFYRAGLGSLLGKRFLMFQHFGRVSGIIRETVVEVVDLDADSGVIYIGSGWGEKSDWYQNVRKTPEINVVHGRERFAAKAISLSETEGRAILARYAQKHPASFGTLGRSVLGQPIDKNDEGVDLMAKHVPIIAICPEQELNSI